MINKYILKKNKSIKLRNKIDNNKLNRLTVHKTSKHIYAQILSIDKKRIEVSVSTIDKNIKNYLIKNNIYTGNIKSAKIVGKYIAQKSIKIGINNVYFDRSGLKFHGRIKELANCAKSNGLKF